MTFGELASCPVPGGHIYYKGFLAEAGIAHWRFLALGMTSFLGVTSVEEAVRRSEPPPLHY